MTPISLKIPLLAAFLMYASHFDSMYNPSAFVYHKQVALIDEEANTRSPADCDVNLRDDYLFASGKILEADFYYNKDGNLKDVLYKDETNVGDCISPSPTSDECEATDLHTLNDQSALRYRAFFPKKQSHNYNTRQLPLVVLFHGGGFAECSDYDDLIGDNYYLKLMATEFARKGFICILAHYRTGKVNDNTGAGQYTSAQQALASCRAQQDALGALRSIIKRDRIDGHANAVSNNTFNFKINTNQVFIGGFSAGGIAAFGAAYYTSQEMMNEVFPVTNGSDLTIEEALGARNADYYYGDDVPENNVVIRGVLGCWSGIAFPKKYDGAAQGTTKEEYEFFKSSNPLYNAPLIAFQGADDNVIDYDDDENQDFYFSTANDYKKENYCLYGSGAFKIKGNNNSSDVKVKQGSCLNMYNILKDSHINRFTELYVDSDAKHGFKDADYHITNPTTNNLVKYFVQRSSVFFQKIMMYNIANSFSSHPPFQYAGTSTFFYDAENVRINTCPE